MHWTEGTLDVDRRLDSLGGAVQPDPEPQAGDGAQPVDQPASASQCTPDPLPDADEFEPTIGGAVGRIDIPPDTWPAPGWARYQPVELLGAGGMGRVFKAWDPQLRRPVAVKFLTSTDPPLKQRFFREAQAQARVAHPNVCKVYEVGEVDCRPYIAMQYIAGATLRELAPELALEQKVLILAQVAEAVHAAHRMGLIHRDLKPANIMLETSDDGARRPYVVDFGLAREIGAEGLTVTGDTLGTPAFMAPEQARGDTDKIDRRTDVYSLGATLFTVIAGRPPFAEGTPLEVLRRVVNDDAPSLSRIATTVPRDLATVVATCLEKEPSRRFDSARALAEDLRRFLEGEPVRARPASLTYRLAKKARKHRAVVTVSLVALLAVVSLLGLWLNARQNAAVQAELALVFTHQVERAELELWKAESLELHDVRPIKKLVRAQLAEIEATMSVRGQVASGPGHAAIGRGLFALGDDSKAREYLLKAWNAGYQSPDLALTLGETLGRLYRHELVASERIRDPKERRAREIELRAAYRDPALMFLQSGARQDASSPEYVRALLASYQGRNEDAVSEARAAFRRQPWLVEAKLLEASVIRMSAGDMRQTGRWDELYRRMEEADAALHQALAVARSSPAVHESLCSLWQQVLYTQVWLQGAGSEKVAGQAIAACQAALTVDADSSSALRDLAETHIAWAEHQLGQGQDPASSALAAIDAAERALRLDGRDSLAMSALGYAYWQLGKHAMHEQGNPATSFEQAIRWTRAALKVHPRDSKAFNILGLILLDRGSWESESGLDPTVALNDAGRAFEAACDLAPKDAGALVNLGIVAQTMLEEEVKRGTGDPQATARRGLEALDRAAALSPKLYWTYTYVGAIHGQLAKWQLKRGLDPAPEVASSTASFTAALALNPNDVNTYYYFLDVLLVAARAEHDAGRSPVAALARARQVLREGLKVDPSSSALGYRRAELESLAGQRAEKQRSRTHRPGE